ncbi:MAG TPA: quinolinate synthase NadA [Patescibacteria group bacterium]|nr:quinolinate synthase NadA [Patescibacteria group bacterium]
MQAQKLTYTDEVAASTAPFYSRVAKFYPEAQWRALAPYVHEINRLKREKNAVILAHNYMTPDIFHCVADVVGDSLALAREAAKSKADIIVQAGVHFMAETAKVLNPDKVVLMPDMRAGCSLAESITAEDVRNLRQKYPGVPIITYVNTSAEVKAESDVCCTSGNAVKIVEGLDVPEVVMIPDQYLAAYTAARTKVKVHTWQGACEVHERFKATDVKRFKTLGSNVVVLAHPECPPEVIEAADYTGSTQQMIQYVEKQKPQKVVMITECSMSDNVSSAHPDIEFLSGCRMCPHMKRISLPKILHSLQTMTTPIEIDPAIAGRARKAVEKMLELSA